MSGSAQTRPSTGAQLAVAGRNIAITIVVLGGMFYFYSTFVKTTRELKLLREKISTLIKHDNPADYRAAAKLLDEGLAMRENESWFIAARSDVAALLWVEQGEPDNKAAAEKYLAIAKERKINRQERFDAEALTLIGNGHADQAVTMLLDVGQRSAGSAGISADLGIGDEKAGKLEVAKKLFKDAADRDWINPRFNALYAESLYDSSDYSGAQATFLKALEANSNHVRSLIGKIRADVARGEKVPENAKAIDDILANADTLSPMLRGRALVAKAEVQLAQGDAAGAETSARKALEAKVDGDSAAAYAQYDLGLALSMQKKAGAAEAFNAAIAQTSYVPHFYFDGAMALAKQGQTAEAAKLYDQYAQKITENGKMKLDDAYHRAKGDFLVFTEKLDDAIKEYELARNDNPVVAETYYKEALTYEKLAAKESDKAARQKILNSALEQLGNATKYKERYPEAYRETGMIFLNADPKDEKALQNFGKALLYYKEARAPKAVTDAFVEEVAQGYAKAGPKFKKDAADWREAAGKLLTP
jgi:tetratricopeptide (TPR) repeat protein